MGNTVIGWVNSVKTATIVADASAEPALPVTNIAGDQGSPASAWQTLSGALAPTLTITLAARTTLRAFGVFRSNLTAAATISIVAKTNPGSVVTGVWSGSPVNGQFVAVASADLIADVVTIAFSDTGNPDNHINIPLVFAGAAWQPLTAMSWASTMGRDAVSDTVKTRGGQTYVDLRASGRRWDIALDGVRDTEAFTQLDVLARYCLIGGNVLLCPNIASANLQNEATFGVLQPTADVSFPLGVGARRSWRASLSERL